MKLGIIIWCCMIMYFHCIFGYRKQCTECVEKLSERIFDTCDLILLLSCSKEGEQFPSFSSGQEVLGMASRKLCYEWRKRLTKYETTDISFFLQPCIPHESFIRTEISNGNLTKHEIEKRIQKEIANISRIIDDAKKGKYLHLVNETENSKVEKTRSITKNMNSKHELEKLLGVKTDNVEAKMPSSSDFAEGNYTNGFWGAESASVITSLTFKGSEQLSEYSRGKITVKKRDKLFENENAKTKETNETTINKTSINNNDINEFTDNTTIMGNTSRVALHGSSNVTHFPNDTEQTNTNETDVYTASSIKYTSQTIANTVGFHSGTTNESTTTVPTSFLPLTEETARPEVNATVSSMSITDSCAVTCSQQDHYGEIWTGCPGVLVTQHCPYGAFGEATWQCDVNGGTFIGDMPNYSKCSHFWIVLYYYYVLEDEDALWIASEIDKYTNHILFFGHEMEDILELLSYTFNLHLKQLWDRYFIESPNIRLIKSTSFTELTTAVLDKLMQCRIGMLQLEESQRVTLGLLVTKLSVEVGFALASYAAEMGENVTYNATFNANQSVVFGVDLLDKNSSNSYLVFPSTGGHDATSGELQSHISVNIGSQGQFSRPRSVGMILDSGPASLMFPPSRNRLSDADNKMKILNSKLLSFTLQDQDHYFVRTVEHFMENSSDRMEAVRVVLKHVTQVKGPRDGIVRRDLYPGEEVSAVIGSARCVFWNVDIGEAGLWDETGCRVEYSDESHTICLCNHLSTFAVLMDVHDYVGKDLTLEVLSWACTGASVLCLLLTLVVFQQCRSIQSERTRIGKNMCVCLVMAHIVALLFLDRTYINFSEVACSLVAGALHYLFLASFCWMTIEGHHLYRMVVRVFDSGKDFRRWYLLLGYGFPAIAVLLTKIIALARDEKAYGRDELCWLSSPTYIWSFIGPVLLLTTINTTVLVLALREAVFAGLSQGKSKRETVWIWIRGWFSLSALLGITWVFGLAYMEFNHCFVYIFVVLNGCQGVFIFLFRCVLSEQVRHSVVSRVKRDGFIVLIKEFYYRRSSMNLDSGKSDGSNNVTMSATGQFDSIQEEGETSVSHVVASSTKHPDCIEIQIQGGDDNEERGHKIWYISEVAEPIDRTVQVRNKHTIIPANAQTDTSFLRSGNWGSDESVFSEPCRAVRHVSVTRYPTIDEESDPDC